MSKKTKLILFQNSQHFVKGFGWDPALEPIVKYQEDWVGTSGKMHAWGVTHSNWVLSQMSMRKILTKKEELKPPSTRLGILGHGPLGSLGWVESWKPVVQGKRRGGTGGANTVQYSTGRWLEVLQCHQTCGLILLTSSLTATKTGGAPLLGLLSVLRLKKQIPTNPISWSPLTWR